MPVVGALLACQLCAITYAADGGQFGLRFNASPRWSDEGLVLKPSWDAAYQVSDRLSMRARIGRYWLGGEQEAALTLGASALVNFRPGKAWRPYIGAGVLFEDRRRPEDGVRLGDGPPLRRIPPPPEAGRDRIAAVGMAGVERELGQRFAVSGQVELTHPPDYNYSWTFNGSNWESGGVVPQLSLCFSLTLNLNGGRRSRKLPAVPGSDGS